MTEKAWSKVQYLSPTVKNSNVIIKGTHSYYSNCWSENFEDYCIRYLYGDEHSLKNWEPQWPIDKLYIGDYVCFGAEVIILLGGNNTHRMDWFSSYPAYEKIKECYRPKGDTIIEDGVWIGMRAMLLPGVKIGEGAVIAAGAVITKDVAPYSIVGGNPAQEIKKRFTPEIIERLLKLHIYNLSEESFAKIKPLLFDNNIEALEKSVALLDK